MYAIYFILSSFLKLYMFYTLLAFFTKIKYHLLSIFIISDTSIDFYKTDVKFSFLYFVYSSKTYDKA